MAMTPVRQQTTFVVNDANQWSTFVNDRLVRWRAILEGEIIGPRRFEVIVEEAQLLRFAEVAPVFEELLRHPDADVRCGAVIVLAMIAIEPVVPLILTALADADDSVRLRACEALIENPDRRGIGVLLTVATHDSEPQIRGMAVHALGKIGCPSAIPTLLEVLDSDKEVDFFGHTPAAAASQALDDILGTNETRIAVGKFRRMAPWMPDYDFLRRRATEVYEAWRAAQPHPDRS